MQRLAIGHVRSTHFLTCFTWHTCKIDTQRLLVRSYWSTAVAWKVVGACLMGDRNHREVNPGSVCMNLFPSTRKGSAFYLESSTTSTNTTMPLETAKSCLQHESRLRGVAQIPQVNLQVDVSGNASAADNYPGTQAEPGDLPRIYTEKVFRYFVFPLKRAAADQGGS